jgi:hypothetical protein
MNYAQKIFLAFFFTACLTACKNDLLETVPNDRVSSGLFWKTDKDATFAANAVYTYLENAGQFTTWDGMSDIGHITLMWREESIIEKGAYDATIGKVFNEWTSTYTGIQKANVFLDNIGQVKPTNQALIEHLTGEVRVLRAFFYIKLAMLYGDVPLVTKTLSLAESRELTRTPVAQVWDFIAAELTAAATLLPTTQAEKGRITKGTALALKARALLYAGRYPEAAAAAKEVMDQNQYDLYPAYDKLFTYAAENNQEVIFDKQFVKDTYSNNMFSLLTPASVFASGNSSSVVPTKQAVDAYQMTNGKDITDPGSGFDPKNPYANRDPRLRFSIFVIGDNLPNGKLYDSRPGSGTGDAIGYSENSTGTGFNVKKYLNAEDLSQPSNNGINLIFMRYAEVLLIYAEAKIEANQLDQSVLDAINKVRQRPSVNMPPVTAITSQQEMRALVRRERQVELAFEGLRYFDVRRWRTAEQVIPGILYGMTYADADGSLKTITLPSFVKVFNKNRDYLWPIPQREKELNPNLTQNPNW